MIFQNRQHAGKLLAHKLEEYAQSANVLVLGIPRGGVVVANEVARALHAPLDVFLARKLGVPGQEELAFGAVSVGGARYLDRGMVQAARLTPETIDAITQSTLEKLQQRSNLYRKDLPPHPVAGKTVILVDDGIATGASIFAAIRALRELNPRLLIVAAPVASPTTVEWLRRHADRLVVDFVPETFYAVGQFYDDFPQVSDREVIDLLQHAARRTKSGLAGAPAAIADDPPDPPAASPSRRPPPTAFPGRTVTIHAGKHTLEGMVSVPAGAKGLVLFAHGSGSSRFSPRNRYVADVLVQHHIATLLFDLLTPAEEAVDSRTMEFRFNIEWLAVRLLQVTRWAARHAATARLTPAYFGASTGAAAAFVAAASLQDKIAAVVSRGGRPDLAADRLPFVQAASLLIVGERDPQVIALNRQALMELGCKKKQMFVVPGATHLFEEPGSLEHVAQLAAEWFESAFAIAGASASTPVFRDRPLRNAG